MAADAAGTEISMVMRGDHFSTGCREPGIQYPPTPPQHLNTTKSVQILDPATGEKKKWEEQKPKYKLQMTKTAAFARVYLKSNMIKFSVRDRNSRFKIELRSAFRKIPVWGRRGGSVG